MLSNHQVGWVFVAYPDERMRTLLRAGRESKWSDARTTAMEPGQPVLFLQLGDGSPTWAGAGRVVGVEERWRMFGVRTQCLTKLARPLVAVPARSPGASAAGRATEHLDNAALWENRSLAERVGLHRFRSRTPYLEEGRVLRLTAADLHHLLELQPALGRIWPG